jgi:molecular chaperone GrpE
MEGSEEQVEADIEVLLGQVRNLTDERDQLRDQVLRAMADFQNFKRRNQQEMNLFRQFATESFARELLPILDNFERSLAHMQSGATVEKIAEGVGAVERQLRQALESQGVIRIRSVGEPFDPALHEALGMDESSAYADDTVTTEIEPGYKMRDKVIRPAKVRIAKRS